MSTIKRVLRYIYPYKLLVAAVIFLSILFAGLDVYTTLFVEGFIDDALSNGDIRALLFITIQFIIVSTGRELSEYILDLSKGVLLGYFSLDIRKDLYEKMTRLPYSYYGKGESSELISRFVNDSERAKEAVEEIFHSLVHAAAILIYVFVMFSKHFYLSFAFFLIVPAMLFIIKIFSRRIIFTGKRIQEQLAAFITTTRDFIGGIKIVKAFATEKIEKNRFKVQNEEYYSRHMSNVRVRASFEFVEGWLMYLSLAAVAVYGGYEVINGRLTTGEFIFFFVSLTEVHENISDFIEMLGKIQTYLYASERVFHVLDMEEEFVPKDMVRISDIKGRVEFHNVSYRYPGTDRNSLENISFTVEPGEVVAIVGRSGSGKSTLANLLLNLYKPTEGKIKIDNRDLQEIYKGDYSRSISVVPQDSYLFSDTISNNIIYGSKSEDLTKVKLIAEEAFVTEFSDKMPDGLNTMVQEGGSNLSGGQRQRVAIARAVYRDPKILVLDEATSSLDSESASLVTSAISRVMKGRTTFVITHKISSITSADKIIVVHDGTIREVGKHEDLIVKNGIYALLFEQQKLSQ